jgi:hypothetical protein
MTFLKKLNDNAVINCVTLIQHELGIKYLLTVKLQVNKEKKIKD